MSARGSVREREIGTHLGDLASTVEVGAPDWSSVRRGIVRARRRRRAATTGKVIGSVMAAAAVVGSVQVGWLPYPGWAPAASLSAVTGGVSALAEGPTRGSLADDTGWLADLREHAAAQRRDEAGGESWQIAAADRVDVIFAGDVEGHRLALVEAPYRWGAIEYRQQTWFMGPAGAPASEMVANGGGDPDDIAYVGFGPGTGYDGAAGGEGLLVVADGDREVTIALGRTLIADGSTAPRERVSIETGDDGLAVWTTTETGYFDLEIDGEQVWTFGGSSAGMQMSWSGRGEQPDLDQMAGAGQSALGALGLADLPGRVVWAGSSDGGPFLLTMRAESGASVLLAGGTDDVPWDRGRVPWIRHDLVTVRASEARDVVAWQLGRTTWSSEPSPDSTVTAGDGSEHWYGTSGPAPAIALVGPEEAVAAEVLDADSRLLRTVGLVDGGGSVQVPDAASVRFLSGSGDDLGSTDVIAWDAGNSLPGLLP